MSTMEWHVAVGPDHVTAVYESGTAGGDAALFVCAHGAGGSMSDKGMLATAAALRSAGIGVVRFNFVYKEKGDRRPDFMPKLMDTVTAVVERVRSDLGPLGVTADVGDARHLGADDDSYDVVLLLGPLYHLIEHSDRALALREAGRVVRPGGLVGVAAISKFASLFDGLARGLLFDPDFRPIVEVDLAEGQHRNPDQREHWFTTAFLHDPHDLRAEIEESGLAILDLVGIEGLAGWLGNLADRWETPEGRETILYSARAVESEPSVLGLSGHLLAVARAPG